MTMEKNITPDIVISALASQTSAATSDFPIEVFPAKLQRLVLELHTSCGFPIDYTHRQCLRLSLLQSEIPIAWKGNATGVNRP